MIVGLLSERNTTTFTWWLASLIKPDEGAVYLNDEDITRLLYRRAKLGIG